MINAKKEFLAHIESKEVKFVKIKYDDYRFDNGLKFESAGDFVSICDFVRVCDENALLENQLNNAIAEIAKLKRKARGY